MLVEIRDYVFRPGGLPKYLQAVAEHRASIEIFSQNLVGMWVAESGVLNRLVHVWRYADRDDRAMARGASMATTAWRDFGAVAIPLVDHQHSMVYEGTFDDLPREGLSVGYFDILTLTCHRSTSRPVAEGLRSAVQAHLAEDFAVAASLMSGEGARCETVFFVRSESFAARADAWRAADLGTFVAGLDDTGDHHLEITSDLFIPVAPVRPPNA